MTTESKESRTRKTNYETAIIQSDGMEIRVSVELREIDTFTGSLERTGNWFSCVTDLKEGHILGGSTSGSGNIFSSPLEIARGLLDERLKRGKIQ